MLGVHLFFVTLADLDPLPVESIGTMCRTNRLDVKCWDTNRPALRTLDALLLRRFLSFFCKILLFCHSYLLIIFSLLKNSNKIPACFHRLLKRLARILEQLDITCLADRPTHADAHCH